MSYPGLERLLSPNTFHSRKTAEMKPRSFCCSQPRSGTLADRSGYGVRVVNNPLLMLRTLHSLSAPRELYVLQLVDAAKCYNPLASDAKSSGRCGVFARFSTW
jgi:hypothetical protein